ncbi:MAG: DUF4340 domain-containing protein [Syntrophobacterales bacterium]|jgi:hypothetical protein
MRTRTALIYLTLFLVLAGYFYYFEVVGRRTRTEQEEAARHLFQVDKAQITFLQLSRGETKPIYLTRNGHWQIVEPIHTRGDELAVQSLLTTLESLKMEREVEAAAQDLQPFGLDQPTLKISFLAAGSQRELRIGAKAVVGNQYYASTDPENRVVLIAGEKRQSLDKSLSDLRSKEFFTANSDEIERIELDRGKNVFVLTRAENKLWRAPAAVEVKIKTSKVERFLDRLLRLRAKQFLDNEEDNFSLLGLDPAKIRLEIASQEKTETLLLGNTKEDESVYAKGGELPGVAMVQKSLLDELPQTLSDLEDRTLLEFDLDHVRALALVLAGEAARLERNEETWNWLGDENRKAPENWRINSLLWNVQELEYLPGDFPQAQSSAANTVLELVLYSEHDDKLGTFSLLETPSAKTERGVIWFFPGSEEPRSYWLSGESLRELHENVKKLLNPET